jgi:hypothetical protein
VFLFRWIYRGPAYSYANDEDFTTVSRDVEFWQEVIDRANTKYHILYSYQNSIIDRASRGYPIRIPSGREYLFEPKTDYRGVMRYKEQDITNWPNQGYAADIMIAARRNVHTHVTSKYKNALLINTVHDDVELDVDNDPELLYNICIGLENAFREIPETFEHLWGYKMVVPMSGEVSYGPNLRVLKLFEKDQGVRQFYAD